MRSTARVMLSAVFVAAMAAAAWAQPPAGGGTGHPMPGQGQMGHGPGQGMGPMAALAKLNLTDEQMQQVHKLMAEAQSKSQATMDEMRKLHEQLKDQVFADSGPSDEAKATAQKISELQATMIQSHVEMAGQVSAILTPEQRKKLREMPMGEMMGMMGPGGMGHSAPMKRPAKK
jgi:periplasmic protein CpxP/Spy